MHPLDNIIWNALTTHQQAYAQGSGLARRFMPAIGPLAAIAEQSDSAYDALAGLTRAGDEMALFLPAPYQPRSGWVVARGALLLQMVWAGKNADGPEMDAAPLSAACSPEMIALATLTKPGPFSTRTHELGNFFGIRRDGKLAAMAGERMRVPGYTEVSAVCTHPDHASRGYAAAVLRRVMRGIVQRGQTPFLHVRDGNDRATELYARLGFRPRASWHFVILTRV